MPDTADWMMGRAMARTALYWARTHENDAAAVQDPDLVLAVTTWLIWAQADAKGSEVFADLDTTRMPEQIPDCATDYERTLLTPLVEGAIAPQSERLLSVDAMRLSVRWVARANTDGMPEHGDPIITVVLDDPVHLGDEAGETVKVGCPVCGTCQGLRWDWDGITATASCPEGHATWTPNSHGRPLTALDWEHMTGQTARSWMDVEGLHTPPSAGTGAAGTTARESNPFLNPPPELANVFQVQHRAVYFSAALLAAAYDGDTERTRELVEEVCRHDADQIEELRGKFLWSVAMKLDRHVGELGELVERHVGEQTPETVHERTASLLAQAPEELRAQAIDLHRAVLAGSERMKVLQDGPTTPERARVELTVLAARAACWLTVPVIKRPQSLLCEFAHEAVQAAVDGGLMPNTRQVEASEAEGLRYLTERYGRAFTDLIPTHSAERALSEIEMIAMARRAVLTGYPTGELFARSLAQLMEQQLSSLPPTGSAPARPRTSAEQARINAKARDQKRKQRKKKRKR